MERIPGLMCACILCFTLGLVIGDLSLILISGIGAILLGASWIAGDWK